MTDAMAAAGMADGAYRLGSLAVDVVDGVATIAGSTATMDHVFRYAVENSGLPRDDALLAAVRQSSVNPARALGLPEAGLAAGAAADLVVLDADLTVTGTRATGRGSREPPRGEPAGVPSRAVRGVGLTARRPAVDRDEPTSAGVDPPRGSRCG